MIKSEQWKPTFESNRSDRRRIIPTSGHTVGTKATLRMSTKATTKILHTNQTDGQEDSRDDSSDSHAISCHGEVGDNKVLSFISAIMGKIKLPVPAEIISLLPQIIACCIKNTVMFNVGLSSNFATIIIPALRGITAEGNSVETLRFTNEEASWFGSLMFICQLIGSILSGWIVDAFGRKRMMLVTATPSVIGLVLFYYSNSIIIIFAAFILMGIMNGIMQITSITYTGEICQPSIRAVMVCLGTVASTAGYLVLFTMGSLTNWRMVSLISVVFPITSFLLLLLIPETPVWLLSKNREQEAIKSLQWLRGWVPAEAVEDEIKAMKQNLEDAKKMNQSTSNPLLNIKEKLSDFTERANLKPFFIVILLFSTSQLNGVVAMTPFLIQVFKAFGVAVDANWSTVAVGTVALIGTVGCASGLKYLGKRKICLIGLATCLVCTISLALYASQELPPNWNSIEILENKEIKASWIPLASILGLFLFTNLSIADIPWMYMSELFAFKSRSFSSGMAMAFSLLIGFLSTKTYIDLEVGLSISGTMWLFSVLIAVFIPLLYLFLPETEGISMDNIEKFFAHKKHKITNVNIAEFLDSQNKKGDQIKHIATIS